MDEALNEVELNEKQNKKLLDLAILPQVSDLDGDPMDGKADVLYDILVNPLPVDKMVLDSLPVVIRGMCRKLRSVAGEAMGDLLQNPQTDIAAIKGIKEYAKQSGTCSRSDTEGDAFLVIYHAAIASALVFHDERITQHSYGDLQQFFSSFVQRTWIPKELTELFAKAVKYCHTKSQQDSSEEQ